MAAAGFTTRGGLSYVDRRDFLRDDDLTVLRRARWPRARLRAEAGTLVFTSPLGRHSLPHAEVTALPHQPFFGEAPLPPCGVSFETDPPGAEVLIFWTPLAHRVLLALTRLGWDTGPYLTR